MSRRKRYHWRRPGCLYEFWGYDPRALLRGVIKIVCLYVGQTRQKPETRWRQHQFGSPNGEPPKIWWVLVTDKRVTYRRGHVTNGWLDTREGLRIVKRSPLANVMLNKMNTKRIPPWEMVTLMAAIQQRGGVAALVAAASNRDSATAGFTIQPDGSVSWYGKDAARIGETWLQRSTGHLSSSGSLSVRSLAGSAKH